MFKVFKAEKGWKFLGEFKTFEEAHTFASDNVCKDVYHEGARERIYWFSDENDANLPYKVVIDSTNYLSDSSRN